MKSTIILSAILSLFRFIDHVLFSLRSKRLKVVGGRKNGARERDTRISSQTDYSRLDITSRHQASLTVWWNLSPLFVHGVELRCWRQFRDALYVAKTCFTRTFPQLRSPSPSCQPREKWCFSHKKEKLFLISPANCPRKSGTWPLQTTPHPLARRAGLVSVVAQGIVARLIEPCINDILENRKPLSLLSSNCVLPFSCCFRFLLKFSALKKFTTTGAGYGLLTTSNPVGNIMFV